MLIAEQEKSHSLQSHVEEGKKRLIDIPQLELRIASLETGELLIYLTMDFTQTYPEKLQFKTDVELKESIVKDLQSRLEDSEKRLEEVAKLQEGSSALETSAYVSHICTTAPNTIQK